MDAGTLHLVAERLAKARRVVAITGAGVSAESGIRTFRDTMDGLWKEFDPQRLATPEAFERDPATVTRWYDHRRLGCLAADPNPGHLALARLEARLADAGLGFVLATQNVDRLHQRAGSRRVLELHGSIMEWRCTATGRKLVPDPSPMTRFPPPSPFAEGALLRPDVVWFGELLPMEVFAAAERASRACDVFLSVGTSSVVFPAAGLIRTAAAHGAYTVEINREETAASVWVDAALRGPSGEVLPRLLAAMGPG
ncbi:MAG: NAD-dependent deacylase [Phycisphaerae bacterium]|nr:NAD-dependent deacylase [Phycisphaerae bacterium]